MKCILCKHGETGSGKVTVTLQRGNTTVLFKEVPAVVCDNCGEYYLSDDVTEKLLKRADKSVKAGSELDVIRYAA